MKRILSKGRVIVSCVSVLAILAVSLLSMFTGVNFVATAASTDSDGAVTYPLNGTWDADVNEETVVVDGSSEAGSTSYVEADPSVKKDVSKLTAIETDFLLNAEGNGTLGKPYIIETANQFAAVVLGKLYDADNQLISTKDMAFKIADNIKAFDMNNTETYIDLSGTKTADEVNAALANATVKADLVWEIDGRFGGRLDGNGAIIYGLKADGTNGGLIPMYCGDITIRNLTVKNSYFKGDGAAVFVGKINAYGSSNESKAYHKYTMDNCAAYNNVVISTCEGDASVQSAGILVGRTDSNNYGELTANNCLVYGNIAKHSDYDVTYGLFGNLHTGKSATITNSIILDAAPHALYHGSVAFHTSTYTNVHTNAIGSEWKNTTADRVYTYNYSWDGDQVSAFFQKAMMNGTVDMSDLSGGKTGYTRTFAAGCYIKASDDHSSIKAATETLPLAGISPEQWTYNEGSYPTPKIYKSREYSAGSAWSGDIAAGYSSGTGAKGSPYVIGTAEEFALMLTTGLAGQYFVLNNDIVLNDTSSANWTDNALQWFTSNDVAAFGGKLDGKGHSVSGLYYSGDQAGEAAGLIPVVGNHAQISNIKVKDSVLNGKSGAVLGAVAGLVEDNITNIIKFNGIVVEDTVEFDGNATVGGIIGKVGFSEVWITDCISKSAGFTSSVAGEAKLQRSISANAYPVADTQYVNAQGVYTDTDGDDVDGIYVVSASDMIGSNIADTMPELNAPTSWTAVNNDYPVATGATLTYEGVEGEAWSGLLATKFAAYEDGSYGDGTEAKPHLIKTAEQLAYLVYNGTSGGYYKLGADIYINDVLTEDENGELVDDRLWSDFNAPVGGLEWFSSRTIKDAGGSLKNMQFDGDGYVVYGLFTDHDAPGYTENYYMGLFPILNSYTTVKNVGISHAYLNGVNDNRNMRDYAGAFCGTVIDYDGDEFRNGDGPTNRALSATEEYQNRMLHINNCFVDHTCYISGFYTGGFVAQTNAAIQIENCIFTGSIGGYEADAYYTGAIIGTDSAYAQILKGVLTLPTTPAVRVFSGEAGGIHRTTDGLWVATVESCYYFATTQSGGGPFVRLTNPQQRIGDLARDTMSQLDWNDNDDDNWIDDKAAWDGSVNTWRVVDGGTPMLTIFDKHRDDADRFSNTDYTPPSTTLTFATGDPDVETPAAITAPMFSALELPVVSRPGYTFTGWYVFDDPAVLYDYGYHPARDLTLFAGWVSSGITQNFENYPNTIWDCDSDYWMFNKPGAKGGYKNEYVRNGSKSMHYMGVGTAPADCLLNYEDMLTVGQAYTMTFWVTTDKESNPATLLSLVHNSKPDYLNSGVAVENMAVATGLKVGEWVQYSYSFTAQTKWVSLRATGGASLWFDDIVIAEIDGTLEGGKLIGLGANGAAGGSLSPNTSDVISVAALISAIMSCAIIAVVSRKNLVEVVNN